MCENNSTLWYMHSYNNLVAVLICANSTSLYNANLTGKQFKDIRNTRTSLAMVIYKDVRKCNRKTGW